MGVGKTRELVQLHDTIIVDGAAYLALVAPVYTLTFGGYRVPGGMILRVRNIVACSPWADFTTVVMRCHLESLQTAAAGYVDYGALGIPPTFGSAVAAWDGPGTISQLDALVMGGCMPVIRMTGVGFNNHALTSGGVAVHLQGDLVYDE